jgi:Uncharacterized protein conserved in bacteria
VGISGGNCCKNHLKWSRRNGKLELTDEILKEEKGILSDLIMAAHSNAKNQLKTKTSEEISKATGNFGIPGFKWPL